MSHKRKSYDESKKDGGLCGGGTGCRQGFLGSPPLAQDKPSDNMQIVREKIRVDKRLFLAENMELKEAVEKVFGKRARFALVFRGGLGSTLEEIREAVDCGVGTRLNESLSTKRAENRIPKSKRL